MRAALERERPSLARVRRVVQSRNKRGKAPASYNTWIDGQMDRELGVPVIQE